MQAVKKVEIIADSLELNAVVAVLERAGVSGYTIIRDVMGKGGRGTRMGDGLTDVFKNSYVMTACTEEQARAIAEEIRPILQKFGGICLVSDCQYILH